MKRFGLSLLFSFYVMVIWDTETGVIHEKIEFINKEKCKGYEKGNLFGDIWVESVEKRKKYLANHWLRSQSFDWRCFSKEDL